MQIVLEQRYNAMESVHAQQMEMVQTIDAVERKREQRYNVMENRRFDFGQKSRFGF